MSYTLAVIYTKNMFKPRSVFFSESHSGKEVLGGKMTKCDVRGKSASKKRHFTCDVPP